MFVYINSNVNRVQTPRHNESTSDRALFKFGNAFIFYIGRPHRQKFAKCWCNVN